MTRLKLFFIVGIISIIAIITGCDLQRQDEVIPTLHVLPSETNTPENPTPRPTNTPDVTSIPTYMASTTSMPPTMMNTRMPSPTFTRTLQPASDTPIAPSATATATVTETKPSIRIISTAAPFTDTPTPAPTVTTNPPVIRLFESDVSRAAPGQEVRFRWDTDADEVVFQQIDAQDNVVLERFVNPVGIITVTVPVGQGQVVYRIIASRGGATRERRLPIFLTCSTSWFFGDANAPAGAGCPQDASFQISAPYQPFQNGFMIYLNIPNRNINQIVGLQNDRQLYSGYVNGWNGSTTPSTPPSGLISPQNAFNWMFFNTRTTEGQAWESAIGWATGNSVSTVITVQFAEDGSLFFAIPSGVYGLDSSLISGTWTRIN